MTETPRFSEGQNIRYVGTGKIGTVNKVIKGSRGFQYKITVDGKVRCVSERFLEPVIDLEQNIIEQFTEGKVGSHSDFKMFQTWLRLSRPIENNLYSYLGSRTLFNRYQFKPLLRFLSSNSEERLFIADEVGVGKTIETGIIVKELMSRGRLDSRSPILVVCPASLATKWAREMKERFGLYFHVHDGNSLRHLLRAVDKEGVIPQAHTNSICGLQLLRRSENLILLHEIDSKMEEPLFELVIIDEVHHMRNSETDSNELGNTLSSLAEMMILLSATPLNLKNEDLFNQMHILNPAAFPDIATFETLQSPVIWLNRLIRLITQNKPEARGQIINVLERLKEDPLGKAIFSHAGVLKFLDRVGDPSMFSIEEVAKYQRLFISLSPLYYSFTRTRKREALEHQVFREALELPVILSLEEMDFQNDALEVIQNYYISKNIENLAIGLVMNIHRRMVSSCIPAMIEYMKWSLKENRILSYEGEFLEEPDDDSELGLSTLDPKLRQDFVRLVEKAKSIESVDSKYAQFQQMLEKILANPETPQIMVFSFFVRTLEYLKRRLEGKGFSVQMIHGGIPMESKNGVYGRDRIMEDFKEGKFQILLSSEVGGEGLDFQHCHAIINYDLPYNPMRVEQRIGRIDRFGQKADKIIIANLFIKGTVDEEIYDRLYKRIRLIEDGIGSLEPILGKELANLQNALVLGKLTKDQKEEMQRRVEEHIESAKIEMEEFEKSRRDLLSDDYMVKPLNSLSRGDSVSPEDANQLTELCLARWKASSYSKNSESTAEIMLSPEVTSELEHFLRRPGREGGYNELQPLISARKKRKVVFDGSVAESLSDHVFLSPTGYWSRFLIEKLERENAIFKAFSFGVSGEATFPPGEYLVFFFEVKTEGVKTEIEFLGLPVEVQTKSIVQTDFNSFPRVLANDKPASFDSKPSIVDIEEFLDVARDYLDKIIEEKRNTAFEDNRYRVESRIAAISKATELKNRKLQQQLDNHITARKNEGREPDENYVRLTKARIEKENLRLASTVEELQKRQTLTLDYNLEAVALVKVRCE